MVLERIEVIHYVCAMFSTDCSILSIEFLFDFAHSSPLDICDCQKCLFSTDACLYSLYQVRRKAHWMENSIDFFNRVFFEFLLENPDLLSQLRPL